MRRIFEECDILYTMLPCLRCFILANMKRQLVLLFGKPGITKGF